MKNDPQTTNAQAVIEGNTIVIRVEISSIPMIVEGGWGCGAIGPRMRITDVQAFAKDWVRQLNRESEDGSTPIHRMFDATINEAIEQGAEGIDEHEQQDA
jgi:hypothetical protein